MNWIYCHLWYYPLMRLAHYFNWHHMKVCHPGHDTMLWCHWCGAKYVLPRQRRILNDEEIQMMDRALMKSGHHLYDLET